MNRADQEVIIRHPEKREDKVVIYDFDSMSYLAGYRPKLEDGTPNPYREDEYEIAEGIMTEYMLKTFNAIEEHYNIIDTHICVKGDNNFRKSLYPAYKGNRPPSPPIIAHLHNYAKECHNAIEAPYGEADDMVYTLANKIGLDKVIVCSIDGDLRQIPTLIYDYRAAKWYDVKEEEARHHLATKILLGDNSDNVNLTKGIGEKYAKKVLQPGMTNYQYIKTIYQGYLKAWKGDSKLAKENMKLCYQLLKLHII